MKMRENRDRTIPIIPEMIYRAQEQIIDRRDTHIDLLIDKLREERVRRVIAPMLACETEADENLIPQDDVQYVADMGLITLDKPRRIANAIYREIIPRELTSLCSIVLHGKAGMISCGIDQRHIKIDK